jgi:hypothetical protein
MIILKQNVKFLAASSQFSSELTVPSYGMVSFLLEPPPKIKSLSSDSLVLSLALPHYRKTEK